MLKYCNIELYVLYLLILFYFFKKPIDLFDMNGAIIIHKLSESINKIDISTLPIGIYVLKIEDSEGNVELHKFIKN